MANVTKIPKYVDPLMKKAEHAPSKPQKPDTKHALDATRSKEPIINVQIFKRSAKLFLGQGDYYARFRLFSRVQPNFATGYDLELDRKSDREIDFEAGVCCGAMAEKINEVYGDNFDIERAARYGASQLAAVIAAWRKS